MIRAGRRKGWLLQARGFHVDQPIRHSTRPVCGENGHASTAHAMASGLGRDDIDKAPVEGRMEPEPLFCASPAKGRVGQQI